MPLHLFLSNLLNCVINFSFSCALLMHVAFQNAAHQPAIILTPVSNRNDKTRWRSIMVSWFLQITMSLGLIRPLNAPAVTTVFAVNDLHNNQPSEWKASAWRVLVGTWWCGQNLWPHAECLSSILLSPLQYKESVFLTISLNWCGCSASTLQ